MTTSGVLVMNKEVGAAEFKAHFLRFIAEIERTGEAVTVTKRGRPVVQVKAIEPEPKPVRKFFFGCMPGWIDPNLQPEEPAYDGPWNAELDNDEDDPGADAR
jgi:prevent-host-death family protein